MLLLYHVETYECIMIAQRDDAVGDEAALARTLVLRTFIAHRLTLKLRGARRCLMLGALVGGKCL